MTIDLRFDRALSAFVKSAAQSKTLREKTSIKDVIESCGIPHTEVDGILIEGLEVDFRFQIQRDTSVQVFGFPATVRKPLQRRDVRHFVADCHLGRLVRRLRLLGIDVLYDNNAEDNALVAISQEHHRGLLTRDRRLLMHSAVETGYWLRSQFADEQAAEVIARFELRDVLRPFTRCANCNGELTRVTKAEVVEQLEPLTKIYYDDFRRCKGCGQVYWAGSHAPKLEAQLGRLGVTN
jgi:uncharacterized protein with PIN domain